MSRREINLILVNIDLQRGQDTTHPGQGFKGLEQLPVRLLAASGQNLP